jgi:spermidine/putrescine transport system substrate-binding protein
MTDRTRSSLDSALLRGLTQRRFSRREFLRYTGMGAAAMGLAACGVKGTARTGATSSPVDFKKIYGGGKKGTLDFANWPDYIDLDENGNSPTLQAFTKETGIKVNYTEAIADNESFLPKVLPALQAGQDTGYDLMVITNGSPLDRLLKGGYLTPLDHSFLPNFEANASPKVKSPPYDPGNRYTVAWQSGLTGIGWNSKKISRPITSFNDLFDPAFKGKVGFFKNLQDYPNGTLVGMGIDPQKSTPAQWQQAADLIARHRDEGQFKSFYDNNYIDILENGDIWITQAWSGDIQIAQLSEKDGGDGYPEMRFVVPNEGGLIWTDNMCIPLNAKHPVDAIMMMNFVYKPEVAAGLTDYIQYISPVPAAQQILEKTDPEVADNHEVFPTAADLAKWFPYRVFRSNDEEEHWNSVFGPVTS